MSFLIFALVVLLIVVVICWVIYLIPFPPGGPAWLKNILMVVAALIGLIVILTRLPAGAL